MPIALDPNQTIDVSLAIDADKPAETRPAFVFRFLTRRQRLEAARLRELAYGSQCSADQQNELFDQILAIGFAGWKNMGACPHPDVFGTPPATFPAKAGEMLDSVLSGNAEKAELVDLMLSRTRLAEADKKKSVSPLPTSTAESANDAKPPSA